MKTNLLITVTYTVKVEGESTKRGIMQELQKRAHTSLRRHFPQRMKLCDGLYAEKHMQSIMNLDVPGLDTEQCTGCGKWLTCGSQPEVFSRLEYGEETDGTLYCHECSSERKWVAERKRRAEEAGGGL